MKAGARNSRKLFAWSDQASPFAKWVLWLIVLTAIWRIWAGSMVGFGIGESYYLASARALRLSYFDQPPLFLWILWATNLIVPGEVPALLRLPFILMFSLSTWIIYRIGERVQSARAGWLAALLFNISLLFQLSIGGWAQPEAPLMLFWLLTVWFLLDIFVEDPKAPLISWVWVGLMLGLTFLSKYHAVFLIYGAGLYTLVAPGARKWIVHPGPYIALVLAALVAAPVLIWNIQNDFISFSFQGGRAFGDDFSPMRLLRMIIGQLVYITPWIALPALAAGLLAFVKGPGGRWPRAKSPGIAFFFIMLAHGPIFLFTAVAAWSETQFHFHWQAPGYMMLFLVLAMWMDAGWARHKRALSAFLLLATLINFGLMSILVTHTATGWLRNVIPGFSEGIDPTRDALPWTALRQFLEENGALENGNFVAGLHWTECGHVDNATKGEVSFLCMSSDPRNIAFVQNPARLAGLDGYVATSVWPHQAVLDQMSPLFESFEQVGEVLITRGGRAELAPVRIYRGENLIIDRRYGPTTTGKYKVPLLPLTKIARINGTIDVLGAPTQINAYVDDRQVGAANVMEGKFDIGVQMPAQLGQQTIMLELKAPDGKPVFAKSVSVKIDYHR
ncbi:glycosyltransferase family 39 protein [Maritalea sp. P4.10X]|uniref:Glycosyltransferase family 39 protein n=1 Tax=Maritalea mediterranea TaxID=2909667 RepID=A0ABS9E6B9_9HYPH|nr:glycosyltransferase family 39 protein [Maritalea mediterranea]MCF4097762.1 glycosyltransferase family 39 protein [Maritalea mediterranea]